MSDVLSALAIFKAKQREEVFRATIMRLVASTPLWACGFNVGHAIETGSWLWLWAAVLCLIMGLASTWANAHAERIVMDLRAGHMLRSAIKDACAEGVLAGVQAVVDQRKLDDFDITQEELDKALGEAFFQITRTPLASS